MLYTQRRDVEAENTHTHTQTLDYNGVDVLATAVHSRRTNTSQLAAAFDGRRRTVPLLHSPVPAGQQHSFSAAARTSCVGGERTGGQDADVDGRHHALVAAAAAATHRRHVTPAARRHCTRPPPNSTLHFANCRRCCIRHWRDFFVCSLQPIFQRD